MSNNFEHYKKAADEFHLLYEAFTAAGFSDEQAFELVKAHCTSQTIQNILDYERRKNERVNYRDLHRRMQNDKTFTNAMKEEKTND